MRKITPLMIFAIVWLTLVLVSWFSIPAWQQMEGGLAILIGVAGVGAIAFLKDGISFLKDSLEYIKNAFAESESPQVKEADDDSKITNIPWVAADQTLIKQYIELCSKNDKKYLDYKKEKKLLNHLFSMGLAKKDKSGVFLTQAGVLLFCKQDYFPHAFLHCEVILRDEEKDVKQTISGSVLESYSRIREQLSPTFATWNDPRVRDSFGSETQFSYYPEIAIIEALANFYVHRDFEKDDIGYITLYPNRIEFLNPGLSHYSAEELLEVDKPLHPQYRRNPRLLQALQHTGLNQREGRGILRIKEVLEEYKVTKADGMLGLEIENDLAHNRFLLRIFKKQPSENVGAKYLQYLIDTNAFVDFRGVSQTRHSISVRLSETYVPRSLSRDTKTASIGKQGRNLYHNLDLEKLPFDEIVRSNSRIVILGDPGSGKTTLLRHLASEFAHSGLSGANDTVISENELNYGDIRTPVFVRLNAYADAFMQNPALTLYEFILNYVITIVNANKESVLSFFENALKSGKCLILLDGLDEVSSQNNRVNIGRQIEQFVGTYSNNKTIVTSRVAGYHSAPLTGIFASFILPGMEQGEIEAFLKLWCLASERSLVPNMTEAEINRRAKIEVDSILKSLERNPGVRQIATNPLMLTILAQVHRSGARLPSQRAELYEMLVQTLLEDWELARGIPSKNVVRESEAIRLLGPLAYWMHEKKFNNLASKREVINQLKGTLSTTRNISTESEELENAVEDFLKRVSENAGILVERDPNRYSFTHSTFEEYFTAREMIRKSDDTARLIYEHRHDPQWDEPILLAFALMSNDSPETTETVIRTAILAEGDQKLDGFESSPDESTSHRDLFLAVRIIGNCVGLRKEFFVEIFRRFMDVWLDYDEHQSNQQLQSDMITTLNSLRDSAVAEIAINYLSEFEGESDSINRGRAMLALSQLQKSNDASDYRNKINNSISRTLYFVATQMGIKGKVRTAIYLMDSKTNRLLIKYTYNYTHSIDQDLVYSENEPFVEHIWLQMITAPTIIDLSEMKSAKSRFLDEDKFNSMMEEGIKSVLYIGIPKPNSKEILGVLVIDSSFSKDKANLTNSVLMSRLIYFASTIGFFLDSNAGES